MSFKRRIQAIVVIIAFSCLLTGYKGNNFISFSRIKAHITERLLEEATRKAYIPGNVMVLSEKDNYRIQTQIYNDAIAVEAETESKRMVLLAEQNNMFFKMSFPGFDSTMEYAVLSRNFSFKESEFDDPRDDYTGFEYISQIEEKDSEKSEYYVINALAYSKTGSTYPCIIFINKKTKKADIIQIEKEGIKTEYKKIDHIEIPDYLNQDGEIKEVGENTIKANYMLMLSAMSIEK